MKKMTATNVKIDSYSEFNLPKCEWQWLNSICFVEFVYINL